MPHRSCSKEQSSHGGEFVAVCRTEEAEEAQPVSAGAEAEGMAVAEAVTLGEEAPETPVGVLLDARLAVAYDAPVSSQQIHREHQHH